MLGALLPEYHALHIGPAQSNTAALITKMNYLPPAV